MADAEEPKQAAQAEAKAAKEAEKAAKAPKKEKKDDSDDEELWAKNVLLLNWVAGSPLPAPLRSTTLAAGPSFRKRCV